jgi:hypothetical protein
MYNADSPKYPLYQPREGQINPSYTPGISIKQDITIRFMAAYLSNPHTTPMTLDEVGRQAKAAAEWVVMNVT